MTLLAAATGSHTDDWIELYRTESILLQLFVVGVSLLIGAIIYLFYTFYTKLIVGKGEWRRHRFLLALADITFWIFISIGVFLVYYFINDGKLRIYNFLWLATGFCAAYNVKLVILRRKRVNKNRKPDHNALLYKK